MKKFAIFIIIIILIVAAVAYMYVYYNINDAQLKKENSVFENYYNKDISGAELASLINRVVDNNEQNEVEKDKNGKYINNEKNSINIEIKMLDDDKIYGMEQFHKDGIMRFVEYYRYIKFKCTKIDYHEKTKKISYMLIEQTTK